MSLIFAMILGGALMDSAEAANPPRTLREAAAARGIEFGTCVAPAHFEEAPLARLLASEFSVIEAENAMKFGPIHPRQGHEETSFDFEDADKIVAFALKHKLKARGHTLVWHNQNPAWLTQGTFSPEELSKTMENHILTVVRRYAGKIFAWDVVNEAFNDDGSMRSSIWHDKPGIGQAGKGTAYIERALRVARMADPGAKLYYNDYGAETLGKKADAIYSMAKDFLARGVPLDGIGFQAHLILPMNNADVLASIEKNFARFAELGLEIEITELDIRLPDGSEANLKLQADFYRKFVALCAKQPKVRLIQTWGVTDKYSWIPRAFRGMGWALLWDDKLEKKPAYYSVMEALATK